jgi:hypothetical protein
VESFEDAATRMSSALGRSSIDIEKFKALALHAKEITKENKKKDEDYDDAPDEFIGEFTRAAVYTCSHFFKLVRYWNLVSLAIDL